MTEHAISRRRFLEVTAAATGAAALAMAGCAAQPDSSTPKEARSGEELNAQAIKVLRPSLGYSPGIHMDQYVRSITQKSLVGVKEDFRKSIGSGVNVMLEGKRKHMGIDTSGNPTFSPIFETPLIAFAQEGTPTPVTYRDFSGRLAVQLWGNPALNRQISSLDQSLCLSMLQEWATHIPENQKVQMHFDFDGRKAASGIPNVFYPQAAALPKQSPDSVAFQTVAHDGSSNILFHAVVVNVPRAVRESRHMGVSSAPVFTEILVNEWHNVMAKIQNRSATGEGPSSAAGILSYIDPEFRRFILGGDAASDLATTMASVCDQLPRKK